jgi:hypothetical protein
MGSVEVLDAGFSVSEAEGAEEKKMAKIKRRVFLDACISPPLVHNPATLRSLRFWETSEEIRAREGSFRVLLAQSHQHHHHQDRWHSLGRS